MAAAFAEQTTYEASAPVDVSLGGFAGKRIQLRLPTDVASCDLGEFYPWVGSIYAQGPDNIWDVWILDVDGDRVVVLATYFPGTSADDRAEQQAIVDSIVIEPSLPPDRPTPPPGPNDATWRRGSSPRPPTHLAPMQID